VAVEKGIETISLQAQVYVSVKTYGLVHSRRESDWISLEIKCPSSAVLTS
jgi:hypothetical protein